MTEDLLRDIAHDRQIYEPIAENIGYIKLELRFQKRKNGMGERSIGWGKIESLVNYESKVGELFLQCYRQDFLGILGLVLEKK